MKVVAGVPEGIEVDLADLVGLASGQSLTLTFGPPGAGVLMGSNRFSLGPEGSRTVVDITASDMLSGLEVCLPVEEGLRTAAMDLGRPLLLLHHDGSAWESVPGAAPTPDGTMVCASMVMLFSPFAVGYMEVVPERALARSRLKTLNESVLPEVSRASWDSWTSAVTGRLASSGGGGGSGVSGEGLSASLAGFLRANEQALEEGGVSWKELLSGQSFTTALGGGGEGAGTGLGRSVTVWGAGDRRHLSRDVPSLKWSGELFAAHLGADADFGSGVTGGLGVSWFESRVDYVDRGEDEPVEGVHRSRMASVSPYVGWSWEEGSRLWASVGYGSGEVEIDDKDLLGRFGRQTSDSEFLAAAAEARCAWRRTGRGGWT